MSQNTKPRPGLSPALALAAIIFLVALLIFALIGGAGAAAPGEISTLQQSLATQFNIGLHLLCPLVAISYGFTGFALKPGAPKTAQGDLA